MPTYREVSALDQFCLDYNTLIERKTYCESRGLASFPNMREADVEAEVEMSLIQEALLIRNKSHPHTGFAALFDAAKRLGLMPSNRSYDYYFEQAKKKIEERNRAKASTESSPNTGEPSISLTEETI
jgi:hypothetical protein